MRHFLCEILLFTIVLTFFILIGLFLPPTPRASKSLLAASVQKDSLMKNVEFPRIIFIGGSNLSFGLNSQMIKDSLKLNPVNTGIDAAIGLIYMMDNALQYVKEGDIIILIPEYEQFYGSFSYGSEELLHLIFDINPSNIKLLKAKQLLNIIPYIPKYTISKFKPKEYSNFQETDLYGVSSFNKYGDVYSDLRSERKIFESAKPITKKYNKSVIKSIKKFNSEIERKKAILFVSFPDFQDLSYQTYLEQIKKIENEYNFNGLRIIGNPQRYMMPDSLMFDTPAHLIKTGVNYRTRLFIEDFKSTYRQNN